MLLRDKLYINGQWVAPSTKETIDVHNAGTGEVMGTVPAGADADIDAAVRATRWRRSPRSRGSGSTESRLLK
jgi:acyl-CoA reductase-like NAD-dependent aldehyde dehydrogenase